MRKKVVFIDWNIFVYKAIFSWHRTKNGIPPTYTCLSMIVSCLKRIGLTSDDLIILAIDSPSGSWRKDVDSNYKANRKTLREKHDIDWDKQFKDFRDLLKNLLNASPFYIVECDKLEADDIISYGVRYFKEFECVIVSSDSDYDQLIKFSNVKLFSPHSKKYKIITQNPHKLIASKIKKEVTDNLITPILNEADYQKRDMIVNLTTLPEHIEQQLEINFRKLPHIKEYDITRLWFPSIRNKFNDIYKNEKVVEMRDSFKTKTKRIKKSKIQTLENF